MINETNGFAKYELNEKYPDIPQKPKLKEDTSAAARVYADALELYEYDIVIYQKKVKELNQKSKELWNLFQEDLIQDDLKAGIPREACEKAYNLAKDINICKPDIIENYESIIEVARITYQKIYEKKTNLVH